VNERNETQSAGAIFVLLVLSCAFTTGVLSGEEPVAWYSSETDDRADEASGPCRGCFDVRLALGTDERAAAPPSLAMGSPLIRLAPATGWSESPYLPPRWVAGRPSTATWITTGVIAAGWAYLWADGNHDDSDEAIKEVGDYTQIFTGAAGLAMTIASKDKRGLFQYGVSFGVSMAAVQVFKETADRWRPDGTDQLSFPSGHTAGSFFGAGYIYQRYGPKWGVPALVMATYTGFSRVYGQKHFAGDALSGASIGMLSTLAFVKPADPERAARYSDMERRRSWRFEFEIYDSHVSENMVTAPRDTGTPLDFRFDENSNPTVNGAASLDWNVSGRHNLRFRYAPFEQRDVGSDDAGTVFGDYVFPAADVASIYFLGDIRARYAYDLIPRSRYFLQLGGGFSIQESEVSLYEADLSGDVPSVDETAGDQILEYDVTPIIYARTGFELSRRFVLYAEADGFADSVTSAYDAVIKFEYRINAVWDVAIGWRAAEYELDTSELVNTFRADGLALHAAYSF